MLIEQMDKYIKEIEFVDTVNSIGLMDIEELVEYVSECNEKQKQLVLSKLDKDRREQMEALIEGGVL